MDFILHTNTILILLTDYLIIHILYLYFIINFANISLCSQTSFSNVISCCLYHCCSQWHWTKCCSWNRPRWGFHGTLVTLHFLFVENSIHPFLFRESYSVLQRESCLPSADNVSSSATYRNFLRDTFKKVTLENLNYFVFHPIILLPLDYQVLKGTYIFFVKITFLTNGKDKWVRYPWTSVFSLQINSYTNINFSSRKLYCYHWVCGL